MIAKKLMLLLVVVLALSNCASKGGNTEILRKHYNPWEKDVGYTQVVQVGKTLYLSGVVGQGSTMSDQVKYVYNAIQSILADYDTDLSRVVKEVVFTKDIEALREASEVRKAYYPDGAYPTSTWVQIDRLFMEEFMIEVEVEVLLP